MLDIQALLNEKYQGRIPTAAVARVKEELSMIGDSNTLLFFELTGRIVAEAKRLGGGAMAMGNVNSSFLAYLCGMHNVNPLPPHYFCPVCGRFELAEDANDGYDLENKVCCGREMVRDGHGISALIYEPFFKDNTITSLRVSDNVVQMIEGMVEEFYKSHPEIDAETHRFSITPAEEQNVLYEMKAHTGVDFDSLPTAEVMEAFRALKCHGIYGFGGDVPREALSLTKPDTYNALIRTHSLYHGTGSYINSGKELLLSGNSIDDIITCKDDILAYALSQGCSLLIATTEMMRAKTGFYFGKSSEEINERCKYSPMWTKSLTNISYLYSRGMSIAGLMVSVRMMKYKLAYPDLFADLTLVDETAP